MMVVVSLWWMVVSVWCGVVCGGICWLMSVFSWVMSFGVIGKLWCRV